MDSGSARDRSGLATPLLCWMQLRIAARGKVGSVSTRHLSYSPYRRAISLVDATYGSGRRAKRGQGRLPDYVIPFSRNDVPCRQSCSSSSRFLQKPAIYSSPAIMPCTGSLLPAFPRSDAPARLSVAAEYHHHHHHKDFGPCLGSCSGNRGHSLRYLPHSPESARSVFSFPNSAVPRPVPPGDLLRPLAEGARSLGFVSHSS